MSSAIKGGVKPSWIWDYFSEISTTDLCRRAVCSLCHTSISITAGSSSNLNRHLKAKHPEIFENQFKLDDLDSSVDSVDLETAIDSIIDVSTSNINDENICIPEVKVFNVVEKEGKGYVIEEVVESSALVENSSEQKNSTEAKFIRKKSIIWNFFRLEPNRLRAICSICQRSMSKGLNTNSNLTRHIKSKHPKIYKKCFLKNTQESRSDDDENTDEQESSQQDKDEEEYFLEPEDSRKTCNRKKSIIWKFFSSEPNRSRAKCSICQISLSQGLSSQSNLKRHIRTKHPKIYKKYFLNTKEYYDGKNLVSNKNTNEQESSQQEQESSQKEQESSHKEQESSQKEQESSQKDKDEEGYFLEAELSNKSKKRSVYWQYFDRLEASRAKCRFCHVSLSFGSGNTHNLARHIKSKHPRALQKEGYLHSNEIDIDSCVDFDVYDSSLHMEVEDGEDYSVEVLGPVNLLEHNPNTRFNKTMGKKITVAACTLNQLALDFEGNMNRILQSITVAKQNLATYRSGPELEISGYSCEDHFFESDTHLHCWQVLVELLKNPICQGIMIDVGMPVRHRTAVYNCRIVFLDKKIILIRPKLLMCDDGNYRETRWFTPWRKLQEVEEYYLPHIITKVTGQERVPFGDAVIATLDTCIGYEICEELWNPQSSHIPMTLDGVELVINSSGSYMELRKATIVDDLITSATFKCGGCYVYSNLRGCDGQRTFFNGGSVIAVNGNIVAKAEQFSLKEVEVTCATIDLEDIRSYRSTRRSLCSLSNSGKAYKRVNVNYSLASKVLAASPKIQVQAHSPEEEIAYGPACWLWDYLRRSGQGGFFLPLSGGVDSSSTACIVYTMCCMIYNSDDNQVLADVRKMVGNPNFSPQSPQEICNMLFVTSYIGTENSSLETKERAMLLARQIGSYHLSFNMDAIVQTMISVFTLITGKTPKFRVHGGTERESLALQNIQARLRMVMSYFFAQLMLWVRGRQGGLLVLGSANVDESLRGYLTKYDCSSADVNPIGGISKRDLKLFLQYMSMNFELTSLDSILVAPPTAELEPLQDLQVVQTDEVDMGMTYDELNTFGVLRKIHNCGPYSMFCKLVPQWNGDYTPEEVADKVKHFFRCYAINRHKMSVLTPSIHVESYSPDDNRFDHRQFLYNVRWPWQFKAIDNAVKEIVRTKGVSV